ncbi:FAD-binding oxidoreductase [Arenibacter sp. BSSL-BM3]|uniref:FAD-binding oxidoreductase n=1 Tax=Arenibacter arenosicollis TaxID=2762274 RepID=A0ABR7QRN4_9FLAO|nr:FAD-binding oxidoreductase [Arenibacter arenosicollis]MBC8769837.1 FAD-binding oxidoreductase [Arenibacter arenosicollis]
MSNTKSWGNYPKVNAKTVIISETHRLKSFIKKEEEIIAYGNGRSYGDSAINDTIVCIKPKNYFLNFDDDLGLLHIQAGALLTEILEFSVPRGWFLKVTPGTKLITVGGAIASDVHGKNHHIEGCFSECVAMLNLLLPSGEIVSCSKTENIELFRATCGGMGLTGIILDAKIYLKKIESRFIKQKTIKTKNLKETFEAFEKYKNKPYSVAWIDCLAKNDKMGRSLLMVGDFTNDGRLDFIPKKKVNVPFFFPSFILNTLSVKIFNTFYYMKVKDGITEKLVDFETFFYPLDSINNWNRIYGRNGFIQYQFILPKRNSYEGLEEILKSIASSGKGSFLSVLKLYGKENGNFLSFPIEGYSLALDFKIEKGLFELLNKLDEIVVNRGGRIYLAKDARVAKDTFEKGYPKIEIFRNIRKKYKMNEKFNSIQSKRLGI